jgi:hypothetical protein
LGGVASVLHANGGEDQGGNAKDLHVSSTVGAANSLYRVLGSVNGCPVFEKTLSHVKSGAEELIYVTLKAVRYLLIQVITSLSLFEKRPSALVVGHITGNRCPELLAVIVMQNVGKLVNDDVINSLVGISHQKKGKAK